MSLTYFHALLLLELNVFPPKLAYAGRIHCRIEWDEIRSVVLVHDLESRTGTYVSCSGAQAIFIHTEVSYATQINGELIPPKECRILKDWNHISFGPPLDDAKARPMDDYRSC